ncbi:MAG: arginine--tRNA ligase [Thermodesulfobacteriota bacterium]
MIKDQLKKIVLDSVKMYLNSNSLDMPDFDFDIEIPKNEQFGDYSTNISLILSKKIGSNPRDFATALIEIIKTENGTFFKEIGIAGPGFINFHLNESIFLDGLREIHTAGDRWGSSDAGENEKVLVEFVSANPTGYLHFGHARNAAVGDSISRILKYCGYEVTREFYINDAGRQIQLLGESVLVKYRQMFDFEDELPEDGYKGEYIALIAGKLKADIGDSLVSHDKADAVKKCTEYAYGLLLNDIKSDLNDLGVEFDNWYSEKTEIHNKTNGLNKLEEVKEILEKKNSLFKNEGALWFKSTDYGDNQDWVLVKSDGTPTYFYADIAYHYDKIKRGFKTLVNVWGADHHSHVSRLKSAIKAITNDDSQLDVLLIQFVRLIKEGKEISMSKREGSFVTLREVIDEVGSDVTRFFLLMRGTDSHLDFDLDLAKKESNENPVYYIQYAHARIESVLTKAKEEKISPMDHDLVQLNLKEEMDLVKKMLGFQDIVLASADSLSPHKIAFYLQEIASDFHAYYNRNKILSENRGLTSARLYLIICIQVVIRNGLKLLGISAPRSM